MATAGEILDQAIALNAEYKFNEVIDLLPDTVLETYKDTDLYYEKGRAYRSLYDHDNAIALFLRAVDVKPDNPYPYNALGNEYYDLFDYDKAKAYYNDAIKKGPEIAYPYYGLGLVYYDLKEYDEALKFYDQAIAKDTAYYDPYFGRALIYQAKEKYKEAFDDYNTYIAHSVNTADYFTSVAKERSKELEKLINIPHYSAISKAVDKIKELLLFKDKYVTHYTGLSSTKILVLNEESKFRLSEGAFLNDTSEGRELFDFLPSFMAPSNRPNSTEAKLFTAKPFIGSFVSRIKQDDLTLWRMYGKENKEEARGCAITIDREKLIEDLKKSLIPDNKNSFMQNIDEEFSFYRVAYRKRDQQDHFVIPGSPDEEDALNKLMTGLLKNVNAFVKKKTGAADVQSVMELLNRIAYLFKSFEYQYEYELRLVVRGVGFDKVVDNAFDPPRVYISLVNIRPMISGITLGPKVERADEWASAFYYSLDKLDNHPEILISHLPFK